MTQHQADDLTAERAAQLVEAMLVFIEKTSRRKLSFSAIVDMNTGTTENPQDRLVAAVIKHDKQTRQEALRGVLHESLNLKYYHAHNGVQALHEWIKDRLAREGVK